eukprot:scaffold2802_cov110-Isochrysis_galbana.AAC.14
MGHSVSWAGWVARAGHLSVRTDLVTQLPQGEQLGHRVGEARRLVRVGALGAHSRTCSKGGWGGGRSAGERAGARGRSSAGRARCEWGSDAGWRCDVVWTGCGAGDWARHGSQQSPSGSVGVRHVGLVPSCTTPSPLPPCRGWVPCAHRVVRVANVPREDDGVIPIADPRQPLAPLVRARVVVVHVAHREDARRRPRRVEPAPPEPLLLARGRGGAQRGQRALAPLGQLRR